jgi:hypothetical protein
LPFQLSFGVALLNAQTQIKMPFLFALWTGHDQQMICPTNLCHQWCHKFIIPIGFIKLLHSIQPTTGKSLNSGILLTQQFPWNRALYQCYLELPSVPFHHRYFHICNTCQMFVLLHAKCPFSKVRF